FVGILSLCEPGAIDGVEQPDLEIGVEGIDPVAERWGSERECGSASSIRRVERAGNADRFVADDSAGVAVPEHRHCCPAGVTGRGQAIELMQVPDPRGRSRDGPWSITGYRVALR